MNATKILWGQIVVVLSIVLLTTWDAIEWVAWRLAFQPAPGPARSLLFAMDIET